MALPVYTYGSIPTAEEFNAFLRPAFDKDAAEEEFPGHYKRLLDSALSNDPTQIKKRWEAFENELKVSAGSGLSVNYTGGTVTREVGTDAVILPGSVALTNNATNWVHVDSSGTVVVTTTEPTSKFLMAEVVTSGGVINSIGDRRRRGFKVAPNWSLVSVLGGLGSDGDYTLNSGTATLSRGIYNFRNFTIASGATLNISGGARIRISGSCTINGSIVAAAAVSGGAGGGTPDLFYIRGSGFGGGGFIQLPANSYNILASPYGSGGGSGARRQISGTDTGSSVAAGGAGGSCIIIECAQAIAIGSSATIQVRGGDGGSGTISGGTSINYGSGGGSGGLIQLLSARSVTLAAGGTLDVRGGAGGATLTNAGVGAFGGGGGGGGYIFVAAPTITLSGSTLLAGGAAGASVGSPGGGSGFTGVSGGSFGGKGGIGEASTSAIASESGQLITLTGIYA